MKGLTLMLHVQEVLKQLEEQVRKEREALRWQVNVSPKLLDRVFTR